MNTLSHILPRLYILSAISTDSGFDYVLIEMMFSRKEIKVIRKNENFSLDQWNGKKLRHPLILIISGKGIVTKTFPLQSDAAKRITEHPEEFLSASELTANKELQLTFLRRELYDNLINELSAYQLSLTTVRIDNVGNLEAEAFLAGKEFFEDTLTAKNILTASAANNTLLSLIVEKLLLPVSVTVLIVLSANFVIRNNLQQQLVEQQLALTNIQQTFAVENKRQGQMKKLQVMLQPIPRYQYACIADLIGSAVPPGVTLTELTIQPATKKIQAGKPFEVFHNRVIIRGQASAASLVSQYANSLRLLMMTETVQLTSLNRDRNEHYQFEIVINL